MAPAGGNESPDGIVRRPNTTALLLLPQAAMGVKVVGGIISVSNSSDPSELNAQVGAAYVRLACHSKPQTFGNMYLDAS